MSPVTVLMYHAVTARGLATDGVDAHYSVDRGTFIRHLALLSDAGRCGRSVADLIDGDDATRTIGSGPAPVGITFDDGHRSHEWAAEQLAAAGATADFFVNPSTVGTRGFVDWPGLRRMAALGMSIQSHGMTHRHLDALAPAEVRAELVDSRAAIEDALGRSVGLYAPAGGRMPPGFIPLALELGYRAVCTSRVDLWTAAGPTMEVPRFAVLAATSDERLTRWVRQAPAELLRQRLRHGLLVASRRLLGSDGHERLRRRLLGAGAGG